MRELRSPCCPAPAETEERTMLYRYTLYLEDDTEAGEPHYAVMIRPGETIWTADGASFAWLM